MSQRIDLDAMTVAELRKYAKEQGVTFRTACQISAADELVASLRDRDWI